MKPSASQGGSFDILVIGSGSAGAVVAHRLAALGSARVGLIEAGGWGSNPLYKVPLLAGSIFRWRWLGNWNYVTEPGEGVKGRRVAWPRGRVMGGTSMINGMVYLRGLPSDYDRWASEGLPDWSWESVFPEFERSVRFMDDDGSGDNGAAAVPVSRSAFTNPLFQVFTDAALSAGWPASPSLNRAPFGVGRYEFTLKNGERWSTSRTFLRQEVRPEKLTILPFTQAVKLRIEKSRAVGVHVLCKGQERYIKAAEIVLATGAVNSPALLMQSGIGNPETLAAAGIETVHGLSGVGRNLQDHLLVRVEHKCTQPVTLHNLMRPDRAVLAIAQAMTIRGGPAATFPIEVGAFIKSDSVLSEPDIQSHLLPGLSTLNLRGPFGDRVRSAQGHGFLASCAKMRPESRGRILPSGDDPLKAPIIHAGYLEDERDVVSLRNGIRVVRDILAQSPFDPYRGAELAPGPALRSDAELDDYVRSTASTAFHPVGTCKMGVDDQSVVDGRLRVRGIEGLRIADASIMPYITSANTHAPTMMIGERAASFMIAELSL